MMVLPSGETSSETHVPSSVVNSIVRFDLRGRGACAFFFDSSFFSFSLGPCFAFSLSLSFSCGAAAIASPRDDWYSEPAVIPRTRRRRMPRAARKCNRFIGAEPFGSECFEFPGALALSRLLTRPESVLRLDQLFQRLHLFFEDSSQDRTRHTGNELECKVVESDLGGKLELSRFLHGLEVVVGLNRQRFVVNPGAQMLGAFVSRHLAVVDLDLLSLPDLLPEFRAERILPVVSGLANRLHQPVEPQLVLGVVVDEIEDLGDGSLDLDCANIFHLSLSR